MPCSAADTARDAAPAARVSADVRHRYTDGQEFPGVTWGCTSAGAGSAVMALLPFRTRKASAASADAIAEEALAHADALYRSALRLTRNTAEAEDLVQDTYLKALRAGHRFEPGTNLRAWLFTILMNTYRNTRRDRARDVVEIDSDVVEQAEMRSGAGGTPEQELLRQTLDADLQAALDGLPEQFREAVWLRDVEEFTYAEIAEMLAVPAGTVMSRISRGRRLLHERLTAPKGARVEPLAGRG
jgi:RNA polymerase sigma-70 factor, ECF subfamily